MRCLSLSVMWSLQTSVRGRKGRMKIQGESRTSGGENFTTPAEISCSVRWQPVAGRLWSTKRAVSRASLLLKSYPLCFSILSIKYCTQMTYLYFQSTFINAFPDVSATCALQVSEPWTRPGWSRALIAWQVLHCPTLLCSSVYHFCHWLKVTWSTMLCFAGFLIIFWNMMGCSVN